MFIPRQARAFRWTSLSSNVLSQQFSDFALEAKAQAKGIRSKTESWKGFTKGLSSSQGSMIGEPAQHAGERA